VNEQIRELILKAGFPKFDEMYVVSDGEELEQFAELIVNECMDQVRDEVQYITDYDKADQVVDVVKKHFGVE